MSLNKKSVDDFNAKGKRVLVRCDFNVPLKEGVITDETRIKAALPTINKLINDGAKVILCSHLGKVKNGPNEGESLAPVAARLSEKLGKEVVFVADYNVTGEAATAAVAAMKEGDVVLLQNTRFRGKEEINAAMKAASNESFGYNTDEIVSSDIIGMTYGSLFDATQTMVTNMGNGLSQVQVVSWYDNENSYTSQMVRTIKYFAELA